MGGETVDDMRLRHKAELKSIRVEHDKEMKKVKKTEKSKKKELDVAFRKQEEELRLMQKKELSELQAKVESGGGEEEDEGGIVGLPSLDLLEVADSDGEKGQEKGREDKEEEQQKVQKKKRNKAKERLERREAEMEAKRAEAIERAKALPDDKALEMQVIETRLKSESKRVYEIEADGNCLYRAIAHQLQLQGHPAAKEGFVFLRKIAATCLREHKQEFEPFFAADEKTIGQSFDEYVQNVESSSEWGGQIEIQAISKSLRRAVNVYNAEQDVIRMGEEYKAEAPPIEVSFHRKYYSLGEHYNSIISSKEESEKL